MKATPASIAKVARPRTSGLVGRPRLFEALDACLARPLTWVSGPAGSGKTMLVAGYLEARRLPSLWYLVDERDADVAAFFYYMGEASHRAFPGRRTPLPLLTGEHVQGIPAFTRTYFDALFARALGPARKRGRFLLVFDNLQDVSTVAPFNHVLAQGVAALPEALRVVVLSRTAPPPAFAGLRADGALAEVGGKDLRFTLDEARDLLQLGDDALATRLHERTEGWAAGLRLVSDGLREGRVEPRSLAEQLPADVFDYFVTELLEKADAATRRFLLATAVLPDMPVAVAARLTGRSDAAAILSRLSREHLFTTRHATRDEVYRYHPLFREFLLAYGRRHETEAERRRLTIEAADLLEDRGLVEHAASLRLEQADWEGLARLTLAHAPELVRQGRGNTLVEWLSAIPADVAGRHAAIPYWKGVCRLAYDTREAMALLERAFDQYAREGDVRGATLAAAAAIEATFLERGDFSRLDRHISWIDDHAAEALGTAPGEVELLLVRVMVSAISFRRPDHPHRERWRARAEQLLLGDVDVGERIALGTALQIYYIYLGQHRAAARVVAALRPFVAPRHLAPLACVKWCMVEATHHHMVAVDGDACLEAVARGLETARRAGVHVLDPILLNIGAYGALTAGRLDEADRLLSEMHAPRQSPFDLGNHYCCRLCRDLLTGDARSAREDAGLALEHMTRAGAAFPIYLAHAGIAHAALLGGDFEAAGRHLAEARAFADTVSDFPWETVAVFPEAALALATGDEPRAVERLAKAFAIAREQGYRNTLFWDPAMMARLCAAALDRGIEVDYVRDLVRARGLVPPTDVAVSEAWPFRLKLYTLGRFVAVAEDGPAAFGKAQLKPIALLKAIVALGEAGAPVGDASTRAVSREELLEALWPEVDGDKASQSLRFTLHQLRRVAGLGDAVLATDGQLSLDPRRVWVDAWALRDVADRASHVAASASLERKGPELDRLAQRALGLYGGDFLPDDRKHPWTAATRERLKGRLLRVAGLLGAHLEAAERWDSAAEYYRKAIEIDDLQEETYQALLRCYRRLGRRAEAVAAYERCRAALRAALGIEPSAETERLYWRIVSPR
jgi:ATP/maltotriose-dependent transcriptional regulator MalT/DNA-binding SARP family transcriptional activator